MNKTKIIKFMQLAILTAIVFLFQMLGSFIHIGPTSVSLVLIPIVIGALILGPKAGAFLGFVFGCITLWAGISGTDGFTHILFSAQPLETALICLGKGTLAGLGAGLIYKAIQSKNKFTGALIASAAAPIINTGIFVLGGLFLVNKTLEANLVNFGASGQTVIYFVIIGCAGLNFVAEFIVNLIVSPAINTVVNAVKKHIKH